MQSDQNLDCDRCVVYEQFPDTYKKTFDAIKNGAILNNIKTNYRIKMLMDIGEYAVILICERSFGAYMLIYMRGNSLCK